jgi:hypothetical protein
MRIAPISNERHGTEEQMADRQHEDAGKHPAQSSEQPTFAREGPTPPQNDTGKTVDEMNRAAEDALLRNVTPDEQVD